MESPQKAQHSGPDDLLRKEFHPAESLLVGDSSDHRQFTFSVSQPVAHVPAASAVFP